MMMRRPCACAGGASSVIAAGCSRIWGKLCPSTFLFKDIVLPLSWALLIPHAEQIGSHQESLHSFGWVILKNRFGDCVSFSLWRGIGAVGRHHGYKSDELQRLITRRELPTIAIDRCANCFMALAR